MEPLIMILLTCLYFVIYLVLIFFSPILSKYYSTDNYSLDAFSWPIILLVWIVIVLPIMTIEKLILNPLQKAGEKYFGE
jgi:hypothetical protein